MSQVYEGCVPSQRVRGEGSYGTGQGKLRARRWSRQVDQLGYWCLYLLGEYSSNGLKPALRMTMTEHRRCPPLLPLSECAPGVERG